MYCDTTMSGGESVLEITRFNLIGCTCQKEIQRKRTKICKYYMENIGLFYVNLVMEKAGNTGSCRLTVRRSMDAELVCRLGIGLLSTMKAGGCSTT